MILKGSQRANGADLATHLMQALDNESVDIAEVSGTVATDLHAAFAEMEAVAAGTRAVNYLYSLSINPSIPLTREQYYEAIALIEDRQGLTGQPRAIVFHIKDGREHAHVVWSRIDTDSMTAIHMAYDHSKLCDLSCELAHKFDQNLPPGLKAWEAKRRTGKDDLEATMAENAIARETGIAPAQRQQEITTAYRQSDTVKAFHAALVEAGYILAQGDRRRYVIVDRFGKVHSLTRHIKGYKTKDIKLKLAAIAFADLPTVDRAKDYIRQHQQATEDRRREQVDRTKDRSINALKARQKARRRPLTSKEQQLLVTHAAERMSLHAAQKQETHSFYYRIKTAVLRLIARTPALRSILAHITKNPRLNPNERHALENTALQERHDRERITIEREKRSMATVETREIKALEQALRRKITETETHSRSLMPRYDHEHEDIHRLHSHLLDLRRRYERIYGLSWTFNQKADPRNRTRPKGGGKTPRKKPQPRPKTT
ncbi:MAG: relaxase [Proteobacteria bacterium]|nr:relaxase [Pseudomonadota bacterium]